MNILLVSQCSGRAINETRRILDQFAERKGNQTWQTSITQAGLNTLRKLLKASARRNTAVACHWVRAKNQTELIWVVGNAGRFNSHGTVPTNTTGRNVLRTHDENQWQHGETISLAAALAALFHDFGKANSLFQAKLQTSQAKPEPEPYRHEWVSLRLFQAVIAGCETDPQWLQRLQELSAENAENWQQHLIQDAPGNRQTKPFTALPAFAQLVGWLILSHHYLPYTYEQKQHKALDSSRLKSVLQQIDARWNAERKPQNAKALRNNWTFPEGIPTNSTSWRKQAAIVAQRALRHPNIEHINPTHNLFISHIARLCLMWADHYYSSLPGTDQCGDSNYPLIANTWRYTDTAQDGTPKQRLDQHLIGVAKFSQRIARTLPQLNAQLPKIARHRGFKRRSKIARFRWQDKAYDLARAIQPSTEQHGFFGINMASTGCGKTLANARIMYGLADPEIGARFNIALGLRTLTLQTADALRERMGLTDDDMAVLVGGRAVRELHELTNQQKAANNSGSESASPWLDTTDHVYYEGSIADQPFNEWLNADPRVKKLLNAPVLTCTIDHLIPATEGVRGGKQIAPMLRLLTSDLVLDEPDDFGLEDLPALTRLVHWAGLLGSRVLLSSATLPPAILEGLFQAYLAGRRAYQQSCGQPCLITNVHCAWFDEFHNKHQQIADAAQFPEHHQAFITHRLTKLSEQPSRRQTNIATIAPAIDDGTLIGRYTNNIRDQALKLHDLNATQNPLTNTKVSFGLLRMAHIDPLIDVVKQLYALGGTKNLHIHLCCYHARHPLLMRASIERLLDQALNRAAPNAVFEIPDVADAIQQYPDKQHLFLVAATAVAEVGRDHDYDWAIVEPSSMRSIIQLAGRIRRHRHEPWQVTNLCLLNTNLKHLKNGDTIPAFCKPGFEHSEFMLNSHELIHLLEPEQYQPLNAAPRITERQQPTPNDNLVDLEHDRLHAQMTGAGKSDAIKNSHWWDTPASLTAWCQLTSAFRQGPPQDTYALVPKEDSDSLEFFVQQADGEFSSAGNLLAQDNDLKPNEGVTAWGNGTYQDELGALSKQLNQPLKACAKRYGTTSIQRTKKTIMGWKYHPHLGFQTLT